MISARGSLALLLVCAFLPVAVLAQDAPAGDADAKRPAFSSDRAAEAFDRGLALFKEGKYRDAEAQFKRAVKSAKTKEDTVLVTRWQLASEGGRYLEIIERRAAQVPMEALFQAYDLADKYGDTPIRDKYDSFIATLGANTVHMVEEFDHYSPKYSKKYGKHFLKKDPADPSTAYRGGGCIEWKQNEEKNASQLRIASASVPKNFNEYEGVVFWLYAIKPLEMEVIARTPGKDKKKQVNSFMHKFKPKAARRWQRIFVPWNKFSQYGQGDLSNVDALIFQIRAKRDFHLRVDHVGLVKKSQPGRAKGRS